MNKTELIGVMAEAAGISRDQAKLALEAFTDNVTASLTRGRDVRTQALSAPDAHVMRAASSAGQSISFTPRGSAVRTRRRLPFQIIDLK
jgi:hypothetical protein